MNNAEDVCWQINDLLSKLHDKYAQNHKDTDDEHWVLINILAKQNSLIRQLIEKEGLT